MKKKTKKKIYHFIKRLFVGFVKLVLIYPFKLIWFIIKHIYIAIKEEIKKANDNRKINKKEKKIKELKEKARKNSNFQQDVGKSEKNKNKIKKLLKLKKETKREIKTAEKIGIKEVIPQFVALKEIKNKKGKLELFFKKMYSNKSTIGIILGARGTGKSAIGMRLLENFMVKSDKKIYALGFNQKNLPEWIKTIKNIEEIKNDSIILIDESGIEFSSRQAMSNANKLLSELLLIARHKDLTVLFIAQNSSNLEINAIRQADYLIMKPSSLMQKDFERKKIKEIYNSVDEDFIELSYDQGLTYIYADNYRGFVSNTLPSFWNEKVSKSYANK